MAAFDIDLSRKLDEVVALLDVAVSPGIRSILLARKANLEAQAFHEAHPHCTERPTGTTWDTLREAALKRHNYTCQGCGAKGVPLEVHHIAQLQDGGANDVLNLVPLCAACHAKIHPWLEGDDA